MFKRIGFICLLTTFSGYAQKNDSLLINSLTNPLFSTSSDFVKNRLFHYSPEELWEVHFDGLHTQIEANGNLARPDEYVNSVRGASYTWNQHYYNDFPINSLVRSGSTLHKLNLYKTNFVLNDSRLDFLFNTDETEEKKNITSFNTTIGGIGGRGTYSNWFVQNIMGHYSAQDRQVQTFDKRRRTPISVSYYHQEHSDTGLFISKSWNVDFGNRKHMAYGVHGLEDEFTEKYLNFTGDVKLRVPETNAYDHIQLLTSMRYRNQLNAEYNYGINETGKEQMLGISAFAQKNRPYFHHNFGINYSFRENLMNIDTVYRNVIDQDGEGFEPYMPNADYHELQFISTGDNYIKDNLKLNWDLREQLVFFNPSTQNAQWNTYANELADPYDGNPSEGITSLYHYSPESKFFTAFMPDNRADLQWTKKKSKWAHEASIGLHQSSLVSNNVSLHDLSLDFSVGTNYKIDEQTKIGIRVYKHSFAYNFEQLKVIETNYLRGDFNYWKDENNDLQFTDNELGDVFNNSNRVSYDKGLKMPKMFALELPFSHRSKKHLFVFNPQFKTYRNTWFVEYKDDAENYGSYSENPYAPFVNEPIFMLNSNPEYHVTDNPNKVVGETGSNGWLFNQPFFAGTTLKYAFENKKIYMSVSISAYMVIGSGTLGNNLQANSVGSLSLTSANPNTQINRDGRLHSDRAFIVRYLFSKQVNDRFSYGINVKYKDGEPFSAFLTKTSTDANGQSQLAIWNEKGPADNPFTQIFNKREDAYFSVDCRFRYQFPLKSGKRFDLNLNVYNVLDFGLEINEFTFRPYTSGDQYDYYNNNSRAALEIQNPRTIEIGGSYHF